MGQADCAWEGGCISGMDWREYCRMAGGKGQKIWLQRADYGGLSGIQVRLVILVRAGVERGWDRQEWRAGAAEIGGLE